MNKVKRRKRGKEKEEVQNTLCCYFINFLKSTFLNFLREVRGSHLGSQLSYFLYFLKWG